ncbi:MAG: SPASM domain-containing protein, partial [Syntrophaceae bacterium]|nr:SPASM domain-containing protein [Syntrophaceae bacterium]
ICITSFKATQKELKNYVAFWKERADFVNIATLASWSGGQIGRDETDHCQRYPCIQLWESMTISWDGIMVPCCVYVDTTGDQKGLLSNLKEISMGNAWRSHGINKLRLAHLNNSFDEVAPFCKQCRDWRISSAPGQQLWSEKFRAQMRSHALK